MVMAIAGAAVLTQIQGIVSDQTGSIMAAYAVPVDCFCSDCLLWVFHCKKTRVNNQIML